MRPARLFKGTDEKYNIPTARYEIFQNSKDAIDYIDTQPLPIVIKADGLALGKGVIIANTREEACKAVTDIMDNKIFGSAGNKVVVEEFLTGQEVTVLAFTDGKTIVPMVSSQDHKRVFDNDQGPNTGGMGTFSPSRIYTDALADECMRKIFRPTVDAMNDLGRTFKGVLYFGLIITGDGPKVIEYNSRFGDPETQVILPRLKTDLVDIFDAVIDEKLSDIDILWDENAAVCVIMASGGYPGKYDTGYPITGIEEAEALGDVFVYHAGTKLGPNDEILTFGGRVLGVTAVAENLDSAIVNAYEAVSKIKFKDAHFRNDIGRR